MSRRRPRPCGACGYPRVQSGEARTDGIAPVPICLNPIHPNRPACPKCGSTETHGIGAMSHLTCVEEGCMTTFDPKDQAVG